MSEHQHIDGPRDCPACRDRNRLNALLRQHSALDDYACGCDRPPTRAMLNAILTSLIGITTRLTSIEIATVNVASRVNASHINLVREIQQSTATVATAIADALAILTTRITDARNDVASAVRDAAGDVTTTITDRVNAEAIAIIETVNNVPTLVKEAIMPTIQESFDEAMQKLTDIETSNGEIHTALDGITGDLARLDQQVQNMGLPADKVEMLRSRIAGISDAITATKARVADIDASHPEPPAEA